MNNKGFAITTILYGIMILFCVLLVSLLGLLSSYKKTQGLLTDSSNGARDIVRIERLYSTDMTRICSLYNSYRVLYCDDEDQCAYKHASDICP